MLMTVMMSLFAATAAIGMWGEDNNKKSFSPLKMRRESC